MGGERAAIVERVVDAWNRSLEAGFETEEEFVELAQLLDPEVEWVNPPQAVEPGVRHGIDGFIGAVLSMRDAFGTYQIEIERLEERGDRVAAANQLHIKPPRGGLVMGAPPLSVVWSLRGDRVVCFEWFMDPEEAFKRLDRPE